ncbi:GNAT family N-acetyltransferase [Streptomyces sp. NPDC059524]|uniref:GNAT family N-acetyltransferase n=1 Tax=Streptomyces sp. NPDC059524 TaxID=3346856 RepID=UPI0036B665F3
MESTELTGSAVITRVADHEWHALVDDLVVGRGEAWRRHDGRLFLSIDVWQDALFDPLVAALLAALPRPLYTVVDEADSALMSRWEHAGFTVARREGVYLVPTDPRVTGLGPVRPPSGVTILPFGAPERDPLRDLDRAVRAEVEASLGWREMPAEVLPRLDDAVVTDPTKYTVAEASGRYVGLLRLAPVPRQPRIGLLAVRSDRQRGGVARALLADVLGSLHTSGTRAVSAEVGERNEAALALFETVGAERAGGNAELVIL